MHMAAHLIWAAWVTKKYELTASKSRSGIPERDFCLPAKATQAGC
jgi:hypothetical protein